MSRKDVDELRADKSKVQSEAAEQGGASRKVWHHQQHMVIQHEWERLHKLYDLNYEACTSDDGRNARLDRRSSPSNSFLHYTGKPNDHIFVNPEFNNAQAMLDHAEKIFRTDSSIEITAVVPDWKEIDVSGFGIECMGFKVWGSLESGVRVRVTGGGGSPRMNLIQMDLMTDGLWGPFGKFPTFPGCPLSW